MDKEIEQIMEEIEKSLATATRVKRKDWALIPDEQAVGPHNSCAFINPVSG